MNNTQIYLLYNNFFSTFDKLKNNFIPKIIQKIEDQKSDINQWIIEYCNKHYKIYKLNNIENKYIMYVIFKILTFFSIYNHKFLEKYKNFYDEKMMKILFPSFGNNNPNNVYHLLLKNPIKYKKNIIHSNIERLIFN